MKIVDLSRELYHRTPSYPGQPPIIHGVWKTHEEAFAESGNVQGNSVMFFSMPDHGGTHMDAPRHFGINGTPINEYPLENCIVPGICIDLRHIAPKAEFGPAELEAAVKKAGVPVPKGGTVLLCTGHHERTFPHKEYSTDNSGINVAGTDNLGTGRGYSVLELVQAYASASGREVPVVIAPRRAGDVAACYADPARAESLMGWRARLDLNDMCVDSWRWQSHNPQGFEG